MTRRRELLTTLAERVSPAHCALLIIDAQNDYLIANGASQQKGLNIGSIARVLPVIARLADAARAAGVPVLYTQLTLEPDLRSLSDAEYRRRRLRWGDIPVVVDGTWGHRIVDELTPQATDFVIRKSRSSGFGGTDLDLVLRSLGVRSLVLTGVVTHGCVLATAYGAIERDYELTVIRDAVSGPPREHDLALQLLAAAIDAEQGIVDADGVIETWASAGTRDNPSHSKNGTFPRLEGATSTATGREA